jgi:hypothetical protein
MTPRCPHCGKFLEPEAEKKEPERRLVSETVVVVNRRRSPFWTGWAAGCIVAICSGVIVLLVMILRDVDKGLALQQQTLAFIDDIAETKPATVTVDLPVVDERTAEKIDLLIDSQMKQAKRLVELGREIKALADKPAPAPSAPVVNWHCYWPSRRGWR